jgi:predicted  nucleic acid-binding Zn-ribbon protein
MNSNEIVLKDFESLVRNLLLRFQQLKKENADLYAMVEKNERDIVELRDKLNQKDRDYNSLKMAKMIEITDGDLEGAKSRLSKLIRDVNKCIAILSDAK